MQLRSIAPALTLLALCGTAFAAEKIPAEKTEIGDLNGAPFRIDVPPNWNGNLVLYCHGYSFTPVTYKQEKPHPIQQVFLDAGFAVAQSGYSTTGWAVQEGALDSMALKHYFAAKYGLPKQVYVAGHSMGGLLTVMLSERYPAEFVGSMPMCGVITPSLQALRNGFDNHVIFDYFMPGVLPTARDIPADFQFSKELVGQVAEKLDQNQRALGVFKRITGLSNAGDIAYGVVFGTAVLKEMYERAGGSPYDNRNTIYANTGDDNALNASVKRYAADPKAVDYLRANYTTTGRIFRPMLAIHTTYDELVPPSVPNQYATMTAIAGSGDLFVQQYVPHDGHCKITAEETATGFAELRAWVDSGKHPHGGLVPAK